MSVDASCYDVAGNRWTAAQMGEGVLLTCRGHGAPMTAEAALKLAKALTYAATMAKAAQAAKERA